MQVSEGLLMSTPKVVIFDNNDVTQYCEAIDGLQRNVPEPGQLIQNEFSNLRGINRSFWDFITEGNFLVPIEITQNGKVSFKGEITNASITSGGIDLSLRSEINKLLELGCIYQSDTPETPVSIIRNILRLYNVAFDSGSFQDTEQYYQADRVFMSGNYIEVGRTIIEVIQEIAAASLISIYFINGQVALYSAYNALLENRIITLEIPSFRILSPPIFARVEKSDQLDYDVTTTQGPVITGSETTRGFSITADNSSTTRIHSVAAGAAIGELYRSYNKVPQQSVSFQIVKEIAFDLNLNNWVRFSYRNRNYEGRIIGLKINNSLTADITVII